MGVDTMNSEFGHGPSPDRGHSANCCGGHFTHESSEAAWWRSMEDLVPVFEKEGIQLNIEPHPEDWCETLHPAVDMIRMIGSKVAKFLYCAPHTFYFGDDIPKMIRVAGSLIAHVHVADTYNHKASSGLRCICNPPGARVTIHQHMDIGQGEVNWQPAPAALEARAAECFGGLELGPYGYMPLNVARVGAALEARGSGSWRARSSTTWRARREP
jgi:myo-inositol catabolism protein IolH